MGKDSRAVMAHLCVVRAVMARLCGAARSWHACVWGRAVMACLSRCVGLFLARRPFGKSNGGTASLRCI